MRLEQRIAAHRAWIRSAEFLAFKERAQALAPRIDGPFDDEWWALMDAFNAAHQLSADKYRELKQAQQGL